MTYSVRAESAVGSDVEEMTRRLDEALLPLAPPEFHFGLDVEEMRRDDVTVFVCRDEAGQPVAMGALKMHPGRIGEVKRMYTDPDLRGRGVGRSILAAIIERARAAGLHRLVLETGAQAEYGPAWKLYEGFGFSRCGAVLDYPASEHSLFYEKTL